VLINVLFCLCLVGAYKYVVLLVFSGAYKCVVLLVFSGAYKCVVLLVFRYIISFLCFHFSLQFLLRFTLYNKRWC